MYLPDLLLFCCMVHSIAEVFLFSLTFLCFFPPFGRIPQRSMTIGSKAPREISLLFPECKSEVGILDFLALEVAPKLPELTRNHDEMVHRGLHAHALAALLASPLSCVRPDIAHDAATLDTCLRNWLVHQQTCVPQGVATAHPVSAARPRPQSVVQHDAVLPQLAIKDAARAEEKKEEDLLLLYTECCEQMPLLSQFTTRTWADLPGALHWSSDNLLHWAMLVDTVARNASEAHALFRTVMAACVRAFGLPPQQHLRLLCAMSHFTHCVQHRLLFLGYFVQPLLVDLIFDMAGECAPTEEQRRVLSSQLGDYFAYMHRSPREQTAHRPSRSTSRTPPPPPEAQITDAGRKQSVPSAVALFPKPRPPLSNSRASSSSQCHGGDHHPCDASSRSRLSSRLDPSGPCTLLGQGARRISSDTFPQPPEAYVPSTMQRLEEHQHQQQRREWKRGRPVSQSPCPPTVVKRPRLNQRDWMCSRERGLFASVSAVRFWCALTKSSLASSPSSPSSSPDTPTASVSSSSLLQQEGQEQRRSPTSSSSSSSLSSSSSSSSSRDSGDSPVAVADLPCLGVFPLSPSSSSTSSSSFSDEDDDAVASEDEDLALAGFLLFERCFLFFGFGLFATHFGSSSTLWFYFL